MELSVVDRLLLLSLLPGEGDITTVRIVRTLRDDLSFSEEEHQQLALRQEEGRVVWDNQHDQSKDVPMGPKALAIIADVLKTRSKAKKLTPEFIGLYDIFVTED